jgi:hypothetical protein
MSELDGCCSHNQMTQELTRDESEDPGPRHLHLATDDVNTRRSFRA